MTQPARVTRRQVLLGVLAGSGGAFLQGCAGHDLPPTYGHLLRLGDNLTYAAHRAVLPAQALAREYARVDISSFPAIGTVNPGDPAHPLYAMHGERYAALRSADFRTYRLAIGGRVATPGTFSLADLQGFPSRTQITRHTCEEGWSAIAEWTGVPLWRVLRAAGTLPSARFVQFHTFDGWSDGIDMVDALHPQTLLAWGMNGKPLPVPHGGPLRLRVERQVGYKSLKFLDRIEVTDRFVDHGPAGNIQNGWAWYAGI